jgi:ABC-type Mn2+/Zn2+ transport system ATPase subunit
MILNIERLTLSAGSFTGLIGPNGAGKTTFLKLCCGLIKPNRGTVFFENQRISSSSFWRIPHYRRSIGYIPQQAEYNAHLPFTLREVVAMGRCSLKPLFGSLDQTDHMNTDYWLEEMGLYEQRNQTFRSLSGGQQQKALIARAMAGEPRFLLLDEPGANLDPNWKIQLREILDHLYNTHPITVLLISHELALIGACCQRMILLNQGRIVAEGSRQEVFHSPFVLQWFGDRIDPERKK